MPLGSSEITRALINSASSGVYLVQNGKFAYVSPLFVKQSGYSEGDVLGKKSLNFVYVEDRDKVRKNAIECLKGLRTTPYEYRFRSKSGALLWILEKVASVQIKGKPAAVGSFMDITEYKKMEDALRQRGSDFSLLDYVPVPMMVAELDSSIQYVNKAFEAFTGYALQELVNKKMPYPFLQAALADEPAITGRVLEIQKKSGEKLRVEVRSSKREIPQSIVSSWHSVKGQEEC